jgi:translocation and assembly module TamB
VGRLTRRKLVLIVSGVAFLAIAMLGVGAFLGVTRTETGRDYIRELIITQLAPRVNGSLYIGRVRGGLIGEVIIDSLEIRGPDDSLFVATGTITATYDPRDIFDKRILIRSLDVRRPVVHVKDLADKQGWNWRKIFPEKPKGPRSVARSWGDFVILDTVTVHDASFTFTQPWSPSDTLRGAKRDSAIRVALADEQLGIHREGNGFMRSWRWRHGFAASGHVRLAHPDSAGQYFRVSRADVTENYPPFRFSGIRGEVRRVHDTVWVDIPRFDLTASTGRARGKVIWGSGLPVRYDLRIIGDSVSMSDVAWIYPTLPATGGGRTLLHIRNNPNDLHVIEYALTEMDVRSTKSRLRGDMTFGVGGPVLVVKDVNMRADSLDFDLLRTFNGEPFPYDWQGKLVGTVRASGGPVNRFRVEDATFTFSDANVPGAISRARARGELDILFPAFTTFRGLYVESERVDLRTIRFLNPEFAPLGGIARGRAVLDSSWLDLRFRNGDMQHVDGPAPPSRFTGSGRVTWGEEFMTYDVDLMAAPLSMTTMARSYPYLPFRGLFEGPVKAKGTAEALMVDADLTGAAGRFRWNGLVDTDSTSYAATGTLRFDRMDIRSLLERTTMPSSMLSGNMLLDVRGDSLADLVGAVDVQLERSLLDSLRVYPSRAVARFANGVLLVDSARFETTAATLSTRGALGLRSGRADSLKFDIAVDSLGGLRRYVEAAATGASDSLGGTIAATGVLVGSVGGASLSMSLEGNSVFRNELFAERVTGQLDLENVFGSRHGTGSFSADTVRFSTMRFPSLSVEAYFADPANTLMSLLAKGANGTQLSASGRMTSDTAYTEIALDTIRVLAGSAVWNLARAGSIRLAGGGAEIDTLVLRERRGGSLFVHGHLPMSEGIHAAVRADSIPMRDVWLLLQRPDTVSGLVDFSADVSGTRARPLIRLAGHVDSLSLATANIDRIGMSGTYADRRLSSSMVWTQSGRPVLNADLSLPLDLAIAERRTRMLDEPLRGRIRADSTDLSVVQALTTAVDRASGRVSIDLDVSGTVKRPLLNGHIRLAGGQVHPVVMGDVRIDDVSGDIALLGDSLVIRRLSGSSGPRESISLTGTVGFARIEDPTFDLRLAANNFHAINNRRVADLWVSGLLRMTGQASAAELTGNAEILRGSIYIPELVQKRVVRLDDPAVLDLVDTSLFGSRALLPSPPPLLVRNLTVRGARLGMGSDVWLRSSEANINLGGSVSIDRVAARRTEADEGVRLTLDGQLETVRGTYRLNVLNVVQRTFEVEGGSIRFFPDDPTLNPTLDISAIHTVRQVSEATAKQDRRIRVTIGGTLTTPVLAFSSADNSQLSQTDLISYLITGAPAYGVAEATQATVAGTTTNLVFTTLGSAFADLISEGLGQLGFRPDVLQIQAGVDRSTTTFAPTASLFAGTRLAAGQQIGANTFVSANVGLCPVGQSNSSAGDIAEALRSSLGLKIERRLNSETTLSAGVEPSTSGLLCQGNNLTTRGFTQTPTQVGFDLVRRWRF